MNTRALALLCLCAFVAGCRLPERSQAPAPSSAGHLVAAPERATRITPGAIPYPAGGTYRITKLDSHTMSPVETWTARGETIFESRDHVIFRDQQTSRQVEVRGTYRIRPLP